MRSFVPAPTVLAILLLAAQAAPAAGETLDGLSRPPTSDRAVRPAVPEDVAALLTDDFAALAKATNPREARGPERRILARLSKSGSATVDLLLDWSATAMAERKFALALDLLDQAIILAPGFAEAYNRRATVHYASDDYRRSLDDIRLTLALEPRHFGALAGLAAILREIGDTDRAIEVYRKVLEIHPMMESARTELEKLEASSGGSPI